MKPEPLWQFNKETIGASCLTRVEAPVFLFLAEAEETHGLFLIAKWQEYGLDKEEIT
jgi:hypothetical protein